MQYQDPENDFVTAMIRLPLLLLSDILFVIGLLIIPLLAIFLFQIEASFIILACVLLAGIGLAMIAYDQPHLFSFSLPQNEDCGFQPPPEPLRSGRAAARMLAIAGVCFYALLPTPTVTQEAATVPKVRLTLADYKHNLDSDAVLQKINAIRSEWPRIMEHSTNHDITTVYGIVATILMGGYNCDTVTSIVSSSGQIGVRCNGSKYQYLITSHNGLPVARPNL